MVLRRDSLDHLITLNKRHLKRLMNAYVRFYCEDQTHLTLERATPARRLAATRSDVCCKVASMPMPGGLHLRRNRVPAGGATMVPSCGSSMACELEAPNSRSQLLAQLPVILLRWHPSEWPLSDNEAPVKPQGDSAHLTPKARTGLFALSLISYGF